MDILALCQHGLVSLLIYNAYVSLISRLNLSNNFRLDALKIQYERVRDYSYVKFVDTALDMGHDIAYFCVVSQTYTCMSIAVSNLYQSSLYAGRVGKLIIRAATP